MQHTGIISKMVTELAEPVQYQLPVGEELVSMNNLLGSEITIKWLGKIHCLKCGRVTKRSFAQGYCYPCFISIPETEECVLRPELCRAHEGVARDLVWAQEHCLQDHYVYLALSSEMKVGVTRQSQVPERWVDQGAWKVIEFAKTPNRYVAGLIEVELKKHITDKTNWREMLTNQLAKHMVLEDEKLRLKPLLPSSLQPYVLDENNIVEIEYPVNQYPQKITSIDLEKTPASGKLNGIKGQYLIIDYGKVINIRKYGGYLVEMNY
jgi:hypothetical protein